MIQNIVTQAELQTLISRINTQTKFYASPSADDNPAEIYGGTWQRIEGRFVIGAGGV